jgi:methylmalonyl-CoA/ethylmalonyl-CoA epimerase
MEGVIGLHHVGVLSEDLESVRVLAERLGFEVGDVEQHEAIGVEALWLTLGGLRLEVLRPARPDSRAARALAAGRSGLDHVALEVRDCDAALRGLRADGVALADEEPRLGVHGTKIGFLDAAAAGGLRIELVQEPHVDADENHNNCE